MITYMFGFDEQHPDECAEELAQKGFSAAFVSSPEAVGALAKRGLRALKCTPAFPLPGRLAVDVRGEASAWFNSGCPRDEAILTRSIENVLRSARTPGLSGVFTDGARFASPQAGMPFFGCFCAECRAAGERLGIDMRALREETAACARGETGYPAALIRLREDAVAAYMRRFVEAVKSVSPGLIAGAFVFPSQLAPLVGQTDAALAALDVLAPMLYRRYPEAEGPACLNHEYAALWRLTGARPAGLAGLSARTPEAVLKDGLPPERLARELGFSRPLAPILQLDDDRLAESVRAVAPKSSAVGLFAYGRAAVPDTRAFS